MQSWHIGLLGNDALPHELTPFELRYFFTFSAGELKAIRTRRRRLNQIAAALHLGFIRMSGRGLDQFEIIPKSVLTHLGTEMGVEVPTLTSLRALYKRRATLYEHQAWAAQLLGFKRMTPHQKRAMARVLKNESLKALSPSQLLGVAMQWCYTRKILMPSTRALMTVVSQAVSKGERELLSRVEQSIPPALIRKWVQTLGEMHSPTKTKFEWLSESPGKTSSPTLRRQVRIIEYLKSLGVHDHDLGDIALEHQKLLARRARNRRPARWRSLREPRRSLEAVCFLRIALLRKSDELIRIIEQDLSKVRHQAAEHVRASNAALGISLRNRVLDLHEYAQAPGRTVDELRTAIAALVPNVVSTGPRTTNASEVRVRMATQRN